MFTSKLSEKSSFEPDFNDLFSWANLLDIYSQNFRFEKSFKPPVVSITILYQQQLKSHCTNLLKQTGVQSMTKKVAKWTLHQCISVQQSTDWY